MNNQGNGKIHNAIKAKASKLKNKLTPTVSARKEKVKKQLSPKNTSVGYSNEHDFSAQLSKIKRVTKSNLKNKLLPKMSQKATKLMSVQPQISRVAKTLPNTQVEKENDNETLVSSNESSSVLKSNGNQKKSRAKKKQTSVVNPSLNVGIKYVKSLCEGPAIKTSIQKTAVQNTRKRKSNSNPSSAMKSTEKPSLDKNIKSTLSGKQLNKPANENKFAGLSSKAMTKNSSGLPNKSCPSHSHISTINAHHQTTINKSPKSTSSKRIKGKAKT